MSNSYFSWLPDLVLFSDFNGDWESYESALYEIFKRDFVDSRPTFKGKRLGLKRHPLSQNKEATFWHFISEGKVEADRVPDLRRCERIGWPRPGIDNSDQVKVWSTNRRGEKRITIWLEPVDYVIIIAERSDYLLPWTAYVIDRDHKRRKLQKEYSRSQNG